MTRVRIEYPQLSYPPNYPEKRRGREEEKEKKAALSIEALLTWAYGVERVDSVVMPGMAGGGLAASAGRVAGVAELGGEVEGHCGTWYGAMDAHPDARAVHRLVEAVGELDARRPDRLLIDAAKRRLRPGAGVVFAGPRLVKARRAMGYHPAWRKGKEVWLCPLELVPSREQVLAHRALYETWREAVLLIWRQFRARPWLLRRHAVDEALPPAAPPLARCWAVEPKAMVVMDWREAHGRWQRAFERRQAERRKKGLHESGKQG